ncbi:hypothetical protein [Acaryochloris sp. IP29b_bin.137]|uniref:hypothetical protein n=1 Tax=Acaryochloris sp. IP29b_bin.137 TaxID=2969217 RepID=UPI0026140E40|nr:hypothetical protein [Acaryochloris sp. IP29b_bin.137]
MTEANQGNQPSAYTDTQYLLRRTIPPSLYYQLRNFSRQYPVLFLPFARWRWSRWRRKHNINEIGPEPAAPNPVTRSAEIVIEGFPRMGNTFAHIAFKMAQNRAIEIGHHTHAAAQVVAAVRMNIPTIVLIRQPESAITSYLIGDFDPSLSIEQSLSEYISFYKTVSPYRDQCVIAEFDEVTNHYDRIIEKVNQKYGTSFIPFEHTNENVQECFRWIEEGFQNTFGQLSEKVVCRPSESRESLKQDIKEQFYQPKYERLRSKANRLYEQLTHP